MADSRDERNLAHAFGRMRLLYPVYYRRRRKVLFRPPTTNWVSRKFGEYVYPAVDPDLFALAKVFGVRVAVPVGRGADLAAIARAIAAGFGPEAAGYVFSGDTLVPAYLSAGDRQRIGQL